MLFFYCAPLVMALLHSSWLVLALIHFFPPPFPFISFLCLFLPLPPLRLCLFRANFLHCLLSFYHGFCLMFFFSHASFPFICIPPPGSLAIIFGFAAFCACCSSCMFSMLVCIMVVGLASQVPSRSFFEDALVCFCCKWYIHVDMPEFSVVFLSCFYWSSFPLFAHFTCPSISFWKNVLLSLH